MKRTFQGRTKNWILPRFRWTSSPNVKNQKRDIKILYLWRRYRCKAIEVTMMSLSLKALENTNHYEVHNERTLFHTTILPSLDGNIKCGNSLVGTDFYEEKDLSLFSMETLRKLNTFDWKKRISRCE